VGPQSLPTRVAASLVGALRDTRGSPPWTTWTTRLRGQYWTPIGGQDCLPIDVADGLGIGIGPLPVLQADLMAGRLLTPFPAITVPRTGYVALIPFDANKTPPLTTFIDWLVAEGTG
jgi:hypothetical protein